MIVVDSSAFCAILFGEPDKKLFTDAIGNNVCSTSALNVYETTVVALMRDGMRRVQDFEQFLHDFEIRIKPFDEVQRHAALNAYAHYGKGIHAAARLNLADCAAYALATTMNAPLLFKGGDFAATDIRSCL